MSKDAGISVRYAQSVVNLAQAQNTLEQIKRDAHLFKESCEHSRELRVFLQSPIIKRAKKAAVLESLFKAKVSKLMCGFIRLVCLKGRADFLYRISIQILHTYNEIKGVQSATLLTAVKVSDKDLVRFEQLVLKHTTQKTVSLTPKIVPELIGGFVLNIGDKQIDESIESKLKRLSVSFAG